MIDPLINLVFALHTNKGAYALLLGSGVSRSAGIPTGWEVLLDLIRKRAHLLGEDCEPEPEKWYISKYCNEPNYSTILDALAKSQIERNSLLRQYFEPTTEEAEEGLKQPTQAHKAIAQLVRSGHVRVIVTINFDRLMETALEDIGIAPTVISTPDAAEGARPLAHAECTVIKVHGDYRDARIKNTVAELSTYDPRIDALLDRVLDDYGLIVCGWSADWDLALLAAFERAKNVRYTTYWADVKEASSLVRELIALRKGLFVPIGGADQFFPELCEKVQALVEIERPHPLSARMATESLKRFIVDEGHRIRLHDLVMKEVKRAVQRLSAEDFSVNATFTRELFVQRVVKYEAVMEILLNLIATGCYFGRPQHTDLWKKCMERIASLYRMQSGALTACINLCLYPSLLLSYAGGISSVVTKRYGNIKALLLDSKISNGNEETLALEKCYPAYVFESNAVNLPGQQQMKTPGSNYLQQVLWPGFKELIPGEEDYTKAFDDYEYLLALLFISKTDRPDDLVWAPVGNFGWRNRFSNQTAMARFQKLIQNESDSRELFTSGLFKSADHANQLATKLSEKVLSQER